MAGQSTRTTLRFTRLALENWRNFVSIDCRLAGRVILVGANATGKSNLLDTFRFLHDVAAVGGGLQAWHRARRGAPAQA